MNGLKIFMVILLILILFYIIRIVFPPKKLSKNDGYLKIVRKNERKNFAIEVLLVLGGIFLIIITYLYAQEFFMFLQRNFIYSNKLPLLIESNSETAYLAAGFMSFSLLWFIYIIPLKTIHGKNFREYLSYGDRKLGFSLYKLYQFANVIFVIVLVVSFFGLVWGFDEYIIANGDGVYYNPLRSFGQVIDYKWDDIDKIFYTTATIGKDGKTYLVDDPYYSFLMKNGKEIVLFLTNEVEIDRLTNRAKELKVYERNGDRVNLIN